MGSIFLSHWLDIMFNNHYKWLEKKKKDKAIQAKHKFKQNPTTPIWEGAVEKPNIGE